MLASYSNPWIKAAHWAGAFSALSMAGYVQAAAVQGQGDWETTLQARYFTSDHSKGPDAYYDTALNITWLADANYAQTSGFSSTGSMDWNSAMMWASSLSLGGITGWRLPTSHTTEIGDSTYSGSEFSHFDFVTLGNTAGSAMNTGDFINVQSTYWSSLSYEKEVTLSDAWIFHMSGGPSDAKKTQTIFSTWVVHDGDVGTGITPVPEPSAYALALIGLVIVGLSSVPNKAQ